MIIVTITDSSLTVDGHAARPPGIPSGQNIVCAAVSALTLTLIDGLREVADMNIETEEQSGHIVIRWDQMNEIGQALLDTWTIGIQGIRDSYGEIMIV